MSNFTELYDYTLSGVNIQVWSTEGADPITIEAADFFAWLTTKGYAVDYNPAPLDLQLATDTDHNSTPIFEAVENWWLWPRVISQPEKFASTTNLLDALLCEYLNDEKNPRFSDCRTVDQLPPQFLTAAEKAAKQTEQ